MSKYILDNGSDGLTPGERCYQYGKRAEWSLWCQIGIELIISHK